MRACSSIEGTPKIAVVAEQLEVGWESSLDDVQQYSYPTANCLAMSPASSVHMID
jgi:hypothetical protein